MLYVTYASRDINSDDVLNIMPHACPIDRNTIFEAISEFEKIFYRCFGNTLEYEILGISKENKLVYTREEK